MIFNLYSIYIINMSHFDGINFGNDQISANPNIPLMYDMSEWEGRPMLAATNEYPRLQAVNYKYDMPQISDKKLVRKLVDPTEKKETFMSSNNSFQKIDFNDILQIILIIILAIIISFQIKVQSQMNMLVTLLPHMRYNPSNLVS